MTRKRSRKDAPRVFDVRKVLRGKVTVDQGGKRVSMQPWEASTRALLAEALKGNMRKARAFLERCRDAGLFEIPEEADDHQYVVVIPKDWDDDEWKAMYDLHGPPPWKGERDGLVKRPDE